jgi:hypothetical protein
LEKAYPNGLIYLPHGYLTQLIIIEYHKIFLHAGTQQNPSGKLFYLSTP